MFDLKARSKWLWKMKSLLWRAGQPGLTSVSVEWQQFNEDTAAPQQAPSQITSLFSGSRHVILGYVPNCLQATLKAVIDGQEVSTMVSTADLNVTTGLILHRLTARALIHDWEEGSLAEDCVQHQLLKKTQKRHIINLSIQYSIVTQFTSFVAIEKRDQEELVSGLPESYLQELIDKETVDILDYIGWEQCPVGDKPESLIQTYKQRGLSPEEEIRNLTSAAEREIIQSPSQAEKYFTEAWQIAIKELSPTHPTRLQVALSMANFLHDVKNDRQRATEIAKCAFDDSISELDTLSEDSYKDSTLFMSLLRDNLTLWTEEPQSTCDATICIPLDLDGLAGELQDYGLFDQIDDLMDPDLCEAISNPMAFGIDEDYEEEQLLDELNELLGESKQNKELSDILDRSVTKQRSSGYRISLMQHVEEPLSSNIALQPEVYTEYVQQPKLELDKAPLHMPLQREYFTNSAPGKARQSSGFVDSQDMEKAEPKKKMKKRVAYRDDFEKQITDIKEIEQVQSKPKPGMSIGSPAQKSTVRFQSDVSPSRRDPFAVDDHSYSLGKKLKPKSAQAPQMFGSSAFCSPAMPAQSLQSNMLPVPVHSDVCHLRSDSFAVDGRSMSQQQEQSQSFSFGKEQASKSALDRRMMRSFGSCSLPRTAQSMHSDNDAGQWGFSEDKSAAPAPEVSTPLRMMRRLTEDRFYADVYEDMDMAVESLTGRGLGGQGRGRGGGGGRGKEREAKANKQSEMKKYLHLVAYSSISDDIAVKHMVGTVRSIVAVPTNGGLPEAEAITKLQKEEGYWDLSDSLAQLLGIDQQSFKDVLMDAGIRSLGEAAIVDIYRLLLTMIAVLQILYYLQVPQQFLQAEFNHFMEDTKQNVLTKRARFIPVAPEKVVLAVSRGMAFTVTMDRKRPLLYSQLELGKDWLHVACQMLNINLHKTGDVNCD